jgi:hypothetical protein
VRKELVWPLMGVLFIVLAVIAILVGGEPPSADDDVQEIVDFYLDNEDEIEISAALGTLAVAALIFFANYFRRVLAEAGEGLMSATVLVGGSIMAIGIAIDGTISIALAETADDLEPASVQTLQALWDNDFLPIALGAFVFLVSAGIAVVKSGVLPAWLGWVAIVLAILGPTPIGFVSFLGGALWILVASVLLTMRARDTAPPATAPPPPPAAP